MHHGTRIGALAVVVSLLLTGCSGGSEEPDAAPSPTSTVDATLAEGFAALDRDDAAGAEDAFERALEEDPGNLLANYNLGYLAQVDGRDFDAIPRYVAALDTQDDYAPALYNLAILTEDSDPQFAATLYRRAAEAEPEDPAIQIRLGYALLDLGREAPGRRAIDRAVELDPSLEGVRPD